MITDDRRSYKAGDVLVCVFRVTYNCDFGVTAPCSAHTAVHSNFVLSSLRLAIVELFQNCMIL